MEVPQNIWFILEKPSKMDDSEVPLFKETSLYLRKIKKTRKTERVLLWERCFHEQMPNMLVFAELRDEHYPPQRKEILIYIIYCIYTVNIINMYIYIFK